MKLIRCLFLTAIVLAAMSAPSARGGLIFTTLVNFYRTNGAAPFGGLVFKSMTRTASTLNMIWSSVAGQTYQLQYSTDPSQANWNNLGGPTTATNGTMTASDAIGSDAQGFYRVVLLP